ncbi:topoisomerase II [Caulobacter sp. UNC279MFTsu5.1]|uniref:topoisomerase II n=1 Tax=Caulobacter sp. UNC279MFTsu5.1 TaxID=1502775 RepID=UPI0015A52766|nr:topoisomerase II [Caulobacter sp. UNC279MFTsu5.1]
MAASTADADSCSAGPMHTPADPNKAARSRRIAELKVQLRSLLPEVLAQTDFASEASLNATIGGWAKNLIDLHHDVFHSSEQYAARYMQNLKEGIVSSGPNAKIYRRNYDRFRVSPAAQRYFTLFLHRSFLNHFDELSKTRPHLDDSEVWIGQNNSNYGLLITPRWNEATGAWENDRSEIRHFRPLYWTIGHILTTGLVVDHDPDPIRFASVDAYLAFFKNTLVRASGSPHEQAIAQRYVTFVRASSNPLNVPLLIPEIRYGGRAAQHKYRLDFCIVDPLTMKKVGYELSPWSTHGYLSKIGGLSGAEINAMAKDNFEREMARHKDFFKARDIYALIYTDRDLADPDKIFDDMRARLTPVDPTAPIDFALVDNFFTTPF